MRKFSFLRKSPDCVSVFILLYSIVEIRKGGFFRMNITVYLGANEGSDTSFRQAVEELGRWIGESGNALVYGGSKSGLMGALAASALAAGAEVTGVEPEFFISESFQMEGRTKMIELGDAFIAFPGGTGTLEEVSEVMSKLALKQIDAPCVLYNLNGYYEGLKALLRHMVEMGLSTEEKQEKVYFAENLGDIKAILGAEK